jgi:hypothetical protein
MPIRYARLFRRRKLAITSDDLSAQSLLDLFSIMQFNPNSQSVRTAASTTHSQSNSITSSTSGNMRLPYRSSSQTLTSNQDDQTELAQGSIIASAPSAGASVEDTSPLEPASTEDIFAWPVVGIQYGPHRAYEKLPNGTVISALRALVCRVVREESSRGSRIDCTSFIFLPGTVGGRHFPIMVTMLREVVLVDLHFANQVPTGLLPDKMRGFQNAMNISWKTKKHLTAQAVRCVLSEKGFKVLEISCNPPHDIIWARYRHPDSNDQHIAGYFDAASIENA